MMKKYKVVKSLLQKDQLARRYPMVFYVLENLQREELANVWYENSTITLMRVTDKVSGSYTTVLAMPTRSITCAKA